MFKLFISAIIFSSLSLAQPGNYQINPTASKEAHHYAPLLGEWEIVDSSLNKDGMWVTGSGADWNWYTILDGHAIQDDWIQPSMSQKIGSGKRQFGTNIRIYNPNTKQWEQIWASSQGKKIDQFSATSTNKQIIMRGFYAGNESRVTFYNLKENTFDWKMEFQSKKDTTIWKEVYRIHGKRKQ